MGIVVGAAAEGSGGQGVRDPVVDTAGAEAAGVENAAQRAAKAGISWKSCPAEWNLASLQCGWVTVPLNYADPDGDTVRIAVSRSAGERTGKKSQGILLFNNGGPGIAGLESPQLAISQSGPWEKVGRIYDYIGFDPRGVGHSSPISCMDPLSWSKTAPAPDPVPPADQAAQHQIKEQQIETAKAYADACSKRNKKMLPYMTTASTARDLDVIRAALRVEKISYIGFSYGTYLGAVYGTLFPGHVHRMVLDSVIHPETWGYEWAVSRVSATQQRWDAWKEWVAQHHDTYGLGRTSADV
ncbi:alpha/beta fold hydrolase, partial [Streptomyces tubercidicus]|uniref:alpha/beta fold hydrolase n=2 Tax=Streptomyces TaxID=1883 RepID=UPI0036BD43F4